MIPVTDSDLALFDALARLREHLGGAKVILIGDGLPGHRRHKGTAQDPAALARRRAAPADGHDLHPVEPVWGNLTPRELANLCPVAIGEAALCADAGLERIGNDTELPHSFLRQCGLSP